MIYQHIHFDDFILEDNGTWSQICPNCLKKHFKNHEVTDIPKDGFICGVESCDNEAEFYIDFICVEIGQDKN